MDHSYELILKRFRVWLHKMVQCITTPPGRILHVVRVRNHPVAAVHLLSISLSRLTSLLRTLKVKSVESWLAVT